MEKETVLEIEFTPVWDKWAWKITKQNEEILIRNEFKDEELNVKSFESPEFRKTESKLFIKGYIKKYDNIIQICTTEEKELIEEKVKAINEKYGIRKHWRAKYGEVYYCVSSIYHIHQENEKNTYFNDLRYEKGNYFKTLEEASNYIECLAKFNKEWHEKRGRDE